MQNNTKYILLIISSLFILFIVGANLYYKSDRIENLPTTPEEQEKTLRELLESNPSPEYTKEELDAMQKELEEINKINSAKVPKLTEEERIKMQEELEALIKSNQ